MKKNFIKRAKFFFLAVVGTFVLITQSPVFAKDKAKSEQEFSASEKDGYTINFQNVSVVEYLRFVGKICKTNFIFNEEELQFPITIISKEPITSEHLMSTLIQMLRIHNLMLIEENGNLVIHNNPQVKELAKVIGEDEDIPANVPLITRIFRVKNTKVSEIAEIIKPMVSQESILEILPNSGVLIVTDITTNVLKIQDFIEAIDVPEHHLEIKIYKTLNNSPESLVSLTKQIIFHLVAGHPFTLIPITSNNSIYLISTPHLISKALSIFKSLDIKPIAQKTYSIDDIYLYKIKHRSAKDLESALKIISQNMQDKGLAEPDLVQALHSLTWIKETNSLLFTIPKNALPKLQEILDAVDSPTKEMLSAENESIFIYKPQYKTIEEMINGIEDTQENIKKSGHVDQSLIDTLKSARAIKSTKTIIFKGTTKALAKIQKEILPLIDNEKASFQESVFMYKAQYHNVKDLFRALEDIANNLKGTTLVDSKLQKAIDNAKTIDKTNTIMFTTEQKTYEKIKELLSSIDLEQPKYIQQFGRETFFLYKIKNAPEKQIVSALKEMGNNLKKADIGEDELIHSINAVKYIKETNSLLFTGNEQTIKRLEELLPGFDVDLSEHKVDEAKLPSSSQFYIYKPTHISGKDLYDSLKDVAENLESANLTNPSFMKTIDSMQWVESTNSLLFTGDSDSLKRVESLIKTIDVAKADVTPSKKISFFLYEPKYLSKYQIERYLKNIAHHLVKTDSDEVHLNNAIESLKWLEESNSFIFSGETSALDRIKDLLERFDTQQGGEKIKAKSTYYLYKLQQVSGEVIEEDLDDFARKLRAQNIEDPSLIEVIENAKWVKETNSILLTGRSDAIEEAKNIIAKYDVARQKAQKPLHDNFFIYKPEYVSASVIENSLQDTAHNLEKAALADPNFINAINSMKFIESTNSLAFTGDEQSLNKIESLIKTIDIPSKAPITTSKKTTYLIYKIEKAQPQQLISSLKAITSDLKKSQASDKDFVAALETLKYDPHAHTLIFTGTSESLEKIQNLIKKFDLPFLASAPSVEGPSAYFVYKPIYLSGPTLENILLDFAHHLNTTSFTNQALIQTIQTMKWSESTNSLIFTGTTKAIDEIKNLLTTFDVSRKDDGSPDAKSGIQPIDDTSFLVYKLQYHKGSEIQTAMRTIAQDMIKTHAPIKENLLNAINSIQWLEVTNTLLCSGDQETMRRLKELIKNLDIPLKQVFIEMLVIETSLNNLLEFGLDWGSKLKYRDKFSASMSNFPKDTKLTEGTFPYNLNNITATNTPKPTDIPYGEGFDLGIIGDIIMHKGRSFLSLGSLVTALQNDQESSIIMTPKIITQDNKTSNIFIGRNIPYIGSQLTTQPTSGGTNVSQNLEYRDIGMKLTLTPYLGNSDVVTLSINMENTTAQTDSQGQVKTFTYQDTSVQGILTGKTNLTTTVHIPNKNFLVLSGMVTDTKARAKTGIPCLGGLPLIGAAFSKTTRIDEKLNLVMFIRPHIINSYQDMTNVTENQEDYFRENTGSPILEKDYDESVEMLKPVDDE